MIITKSSDFILVIILLEWILAGYGLSSAFSAKKVWMKVIHVLLMIIWVICAILNMILYFG